MSETGRAAREIIHTKARELEAEYKKLPWYSRRRRAEIVGALKAIVEIHADVCDLLMQENVRVARAALSKVTHPIETQGAGT